MDEDNSILTPQPQPEAEAPDAPESQSPPEELHQRVGEHVEEFFRRFPGTDIGAVEANEDFRRFCGSRLYREPLAELYEDYLAVAGEVERRAQARQEDRRSRSTGSGAGAAGDGLTGPQRQALEEWNSAFPHLRMTAREFLSR